MMDFISSLFQALKIEATLVYKASPGQPGLITQRNLYRKTKANQPQSKIRNKQIRIDWYQIVRYIIQ